MIWIVSQEEFVPSLQPRNYVVSIRPVTDASYEKQLLYRIPARRCGW